MGANESPLGHNELHVRVGPLSLAQVDAACDISAGVADANLPDRSKCL
jgi:hypothetical protein